MRRTADESFSSLLARQSDSFAPAHSPSRASRPPAPLPRPRVLALPDVDFRSFPANSFNRCPRSTASLLTGWFLLFHVGVKDRMPFALLHLPDRRGVVGP